MLREFVYSFFCLILLYKKKSIIIMLVNYKIFIAQLHHQNLYSIVIVNIVLLIPTGPSTNKLYMTIE